MTYTSKSEAAMESYRYFQIFYPNENISTYTGDDEVDAFRHAYASAVFAYERGEGVSAALGWANETLGVLRGYPPETYNMDSYNNLQGRLVAAGIPENSSNYKDLIAIAVAHKLNSGELAVINPHFAESSSEVYSSPQQEADRAHAQAYKDLLDESRSDWGGDDDLDVTKKSNAANADAAGLAGLNPGSGGGVAQYVDDIQVQFNASENRGSPLVLDIDGLDGIELSSLSGPNAVYWDIDNDGMAEASGFVTGGDGLLVIDLNKDGIINNSSELFGNKAGYANGFLSLGAYDTNADGYITAEDASYSDIMVWIDDSNDGYSQSDELYTLDALLISSISLSYAEVDYIINGNNILQESTFVINGNTRSIVDAYFSYSNVDTVYNQEFELDIEALFLPTQRGYGQLASLHIAMSLDNVGSGNLLDLVSALESRTFSQMFDSTNDTLDAVRDIMYRWANVDDVVAGTRGGNMDAKALAYLEKMMGEGFLQHGYAPNPGFEASWHLERAFNIALNHVYARLVAQAAGGELFDGNFFYSVATDAIEGITGLNSDAFDLLEVEAIALTTTAQRETFWQNVVRVVEFNIGYDNLSSGDKALLAGAINSSDSALNVIDIIASLDVSENQYGQDDNDHILGDSYTNDSIFGYAGNDRLEGLGGDDQLTGGTGDDYLLGGGGADIYHYASGDGFDTILEAGSSLDEIRFGAGIDAGDLSFTRVGEKGLIIDIDNGVHVGQIWLESQFNNSSNGPGPIETIRFSDNSTLDLMTLNHVTYGTAGNDTIWGIGSGGGGSDVIYGGAGNDTIMGYAPNRSDPDTNWLYGEDGNDIIKGGSTIDHIYGGAGNDTLYGNAGEDILWDGVSGNDILHGGTGSDIYNYTNGHDVYNDEGGSADEIHLDSAWNGVVPVYYKQGLDLKIVFDSSSDILIKNHFGSGHRVETLVYANATTVDLSTVSYVLQGDEANNSLTGTNNSDTFFGFGGNDTLTGNDGDDYLYGGTGNDTLNGGYGNNYLDGGAGNDTVTGGYNDDTYFYTSGHDVFIDGYGNDLIIMADGWTVDDITFRRYTTNLNDLIIEINGSNSIRLDNHFYSNDNFETLQFSDFSTIDLLNKAYETHGTAGNDNIVTGISAGGLNTDIFYGWAGNDTLSTGNGSDIIYGGDGNDTLNGGDGNDFLYGEAGDDTVLGSTGDDYLDGGIGNDRLEGYSGNDVYLYLSGNDVIYDTGGIDTLKFTSEWTALDLTFRRDISDLRSLQILINGENSLFIEDHFFGARSLDTIEFNDLSTINLMTRVFETHGNDSNNTISGISVGGSLNDLIYGYGGVDTINGGDGNDTIYGGDGNDSLTGGDGNDILYGDAGDDTLIGNAGDDILIGGAGNDTTSDTNGGNDRHVYSAGLDTVIDANGTDVLHIQGYTINDISIANLSTYNAKITINSGVDEITVNNLRNNATYRVEYISFDDGFETDLPTYQTWTTGASGADTLTGTSGDNTIIGKDGNDTLDGAGGNDDIHGGSGNDTLYGGAGSDLLHGGVGNDVLYGQDGLDTLYGGAGSDTFVFQSASAFNNLDVIKDFSVAQNDVLDLSDLLSGYDPLTDAITDFVWITESAGNSNVFVDRDGLGGGYSLVAVATLTGVTGLTDEAALVTSGTLLVA